MKKPEHIKAELEALRQLLFERGFNEERIDILINLRKQILRGKKNNDEKNID